MHFVDNIPIKTLTIYFGENEKFIRPLLRTKITLLSFAYISNDLYRIEEFIKYSLGFDTV
jgi:hypothetical protein